MFLLSVQKVTAIEDLMFMPAGHQPGYFLKAEMYTAIMFSLLCFAATYAGMHVTEMLGLPSWPVASSADVGGMPSCHASEPLL